MRKILSLFIILLLNDVTGQTGNTRFLSQVGVSDSLYSDILKEQREIYVQIPESYSDNRNQKYPVAYVLDGEVFLPTVNLVHTYYHGGYIPEMVIVGVSNSENRIRDLTPSEVTTLYGMSFNDKSGDAPEFLQFIKDELIPYVDSKYPVTDYRTLIGHSYGGLFTIFSMISNPSVFENYLAIDPSLDWDNQKILAQAVEVLSTSDYTGKSLYMSLSGQLHMQNPLITIDDVMEDDSDFTLFPRSNLEFKNLVNQNNKNGLTLEWEFFPNELHGTIAFPSIKNGLISLFEWFQMEQTDKFNSPETPKNELKDLMEYRAQKLQDHFKYTVPPYPEDLLNALGYMSMDMGQMEKSKMFFDYSIEYYPNNPNSYDSMADYFERQKDYPSALKFVGKAFQLSDSQYHKERMAELKEKIK